MALFEGNPNTTYTVEKINTEDDDLRTFLFRLGCYEEQPITIISKKKKSVIVVIKDSRYALDKDIAESIQVCA